MRRLHSRHTLYALDVLWRRAHNFAIEHYISPGLRAQAVRTPPELEIRAIFISAPEKN